MIKKAAYFILFFGLMAVSLSGLTGLTTALASDDLGSLWTEQGTDGVDRIKLYFFHSTTCPHCAAAKPVVARIAKQRPWLSLLTLDVSDDTNERLFFMLAREFHRQPESVPSFFLCGQMLVGFDSTAGTGAELAAIADRCHERLLKRLSSSTKPSHQSALKTTQIKLPFVGKLDAAQLSLPALTLILGGLDAFNPCAFFVLLFLLSLMVHAKSRSRMAVVGGLFVLVSGVMYFAFMVAWLNLFLILHNIGWITAAAGLLALIIGGLAIKDYFFLHTGPSLSISDEAKPALFKKMGGLINTQNMPALLLGTGLLAITANLYELLCTSGFPMIYTRILTQHELSNGVRYAWLAAYNIVYIIPLLVIVTMFVVTLGARKLSECEGRALKLMSGLMMSGLGALLLLAPDLLQNVLSALVLLGASLLITVIVIRRDHHLRKNGS
jgi:thiol-disulfide isomerase/thioredoxin